MSAMTALRPKIAITHPKSQSSHRWASLSCPHGSVTPLLGILSAELQCSTPLEVGMQAPPAPEQLHECGLLPSSPVQVTQRGAEKQPAALHYSSPSDAPPEGQASWRERLRALFCCFAPDATEQYYRGSEGEAAVIRPPQPPTPPSYSGEPVIGPLQARGPAPACMHPRLPNTRRLACKAASAGSATGPSNWRRKRDLWCWPWA